MIIINVCRHELHYFEFVRPIEDILVKSGIEYTVVHIDHLNKKHLGSSDKVIICGTSLRDFDYENKDFSWIKSYDKPVLGICAGFQAICKANDLKTANGIEIGLKKTSFQKEFLGMEGIKEVYCLHNNHVKKSEILERYFSICAESGYIQAIKKHSSPTYAVLFHPEVRNKQLIENFLYM